VSRPVSRFFVPAFLLALCSASAYANGVPIIYNPLSPTSVVPGGVGFTLTVSGTGFTSSAVVNWNGSPRTTTFLSATKLSASILAADIASASTAIITVTNPGIGGGTSNTLTFQVANSTVGLAFQDSVIASGFANTGLLPPVIGDFNGDGKQDIVVADSTSDTVNILFGNGDGTFQAPVSLQVVPTGDHLLDLAAGDVNGDGKLDLIASYFDSSVTPVIIGKSVVIQNGDGTFQSPKLSPNFPNGTPAVVADVNGDGKPDIVAACGRGICVGLGDDSGTFSPSVVFTSPVNTNGGPSVASLAVGDFNGDGKLDIAFVAVPQYLAILFGNGDGTFSAPSLIYDTGAGFGAEAAVSADFNGDGILDLAFYYGQNVQGPNNSALSIFLGNGDGSFQEPATLSGLAFSNISPFIAGDFNADGHLDLAADNIALLLGNGAGVFSHTQIPLPHSALVAADFNGDGKLDLLGTDNSTASLHVMLQTPPPPDFSGSVNPSFQSVVNGSSAAYSVSVSPIDGFAGTVQFSVSGLPSGASASFTPSTLVGSGTTSLSVSTSTSTPTGSYTITVTGTSGSIVHSGTLTLNVGPANTDFTDFQGSITPAYQTITPGSSTHYDLGVSPINGFTGTVSFSVSGLPAGAVATFVPSTVSGGSGAALLNVSTSPSTPTGSYPLVVTGTSGAHVHSTIVNLNVGPAGTDFTDFTGFITPASQSVAIGGSASYTLTVIPINGFNDELLLSQVGTPGGVTITTSIGAIQGGSGSTVITFSPGPTAVPGTYTVTITARSASNVNHIHSKSLTLTITP